MKRIFYAIPLMALSLLFLGCPTDVSDEVSEKEWVTVPLSVGDSTKDDIIAYFGKQPEEYLWGEDTFTEDDLPSYYIMRYGSYVTGDSIDIVIDNYDVDNPHLCDEIRIYSSLYRCVNGIKMNQSSAEVFAILGDPDSTETGVAKEDLGWEANVFYENINGTEGYHYYKDAASGIRMFFLEDKTICVYLDDNITAFEVFK